VLAQVLLYLLLTAGGLAAVHLVLLVRRRPLPWAGFVATGAALSTGAGLWVVRDVLLAQARRSPAVGILWTLGLALGFFAAGAVLATAWAVAVRGLGLLAGRLLGRARSAATPARRGCGRRRRRPRHPPRRRGGHPQERPGDV